MSKFIHLHTHSHYSLLDGLSRIDQLVNEAKKFNMGALALTDHGNMYGSIEFYKECKKVDIKPIIGVEAYIAKRGRADKESGIDDKRYHLTLLAKNYTGYKNLMRLVSLSHLEGFYYKPRMDKEILRKYSEGIICLSGCPAGELANALRNKDMDRAREVVREHQEIFDKENYFLELMIKREVQGFELYEEGVMQLSKEFGIPVVGTQDSHYLHQEDKEAHETLLLVNTGADENTKKFDMGDGDYSFINPETAEIYFKDYPEVLDNTSLVTNLVDLEIPLGNWVFPKYEADENKSYDEMLREKAYQGLKERELSETPALKERIDYELGIISKKGYAPYFLVVADLLEFARKNKILSNTRGSAAGSLVSYLLFITTVNPIDFELPFERFLNPERPSPPDIDMDFADNRRDEVIEYAKQKYGSDRVAQVGTFGTMAARGSVRDVARALSYPYSTGDRLSKMIPMGSQGFPMTIDKALEIVPELKEAYDTENDTKKILNLAKKLEGSARHISVHAAGVVIAPEPIYNYTPVQFDPQGEKKIITQYDMYAIEDAGLLKFDFLGIRNLAVLEDAVERVKKIQNIDVDLGKIRMDDKKTFAMLSRGETEAVFQLGGSGMTRFLKELRPSTIHDINAMVALYRPGPMQFIPDYIKRKHNPSLVRYLDPALEKILKKTYGILVYQDDLLMIAREISGYSWGEADKFRKAVGKKIPEEMEHQRLRFIQGAIQTSKWPLKKAEELWRWIDPFAAYGFNKAHAVSYGNISYQTAYMKANYPAPYMTASLTSESGNIEKTAELVEECRRMGFKVLPPDINESFSDFTAVLNANGKITDKIRFGLNSIKNFGDEIGKAIIGERKLGGNFKTLTNFLTRIKHKNLNKKSIEALIMAGAMDSFGERGALLENAEDMLTFNREIAKGDENQTSLFVGIKTTLPELKLQPSTSATNETKLKWEKELLGLYISGHPLDKFRSVLEKSNMNIKKAREMLSSGMDTKLLVVVEEFKIIITKNNERMAFVKFSDLSGTIEGVVFPKTFKEAQTLLESNKCLLLSAKISTRNDDKSLIVETIKEMT